MKKWMVAMAIAAVGCAAVKDWTLKSVVEPYGGVGPPRVEFGGVLGHQRWYRLTNGLPSRVEAFVECTEGDDMHLMLPPKSQTRFLSDSPHCGVVYWNVR